MTEHPKPDEEHLTNETPPPIPPHPHTDDHS